MAVRPVAAVEGVQLTTSTATYYTATNKKFTIDKATVTNTTAGAVTFDLYLVPTGGSAGATNQLYKTQSVASNASLTLDAIIGHTLENGGTIQAVASAATSLALRISGRE